MKPNRKYHMRKSMLYLLTAKITLCLILVLSENAFSGIEYSSISTQEDPNRIQSSIAMAIDTDTSMILNSAPASTSSQIYYVDANGGNDNNNGLTKETAFKTIEKARDVIREHVYKGVTVNILEGVYALSETIVFDKRDSGENGKPNIYQAYPGDSVVISGGFIIDNTDWTEYRHNSNTIYKKNVSNLRFNSLFINDRRAVRAREPDVADEPYYLVDGVDEEGSISFFFHEGHIDPDWKNLRNIEVLSYMRWIAPRMKIDRVNGKKVYFQGSLSEGRMYDWDYYGHPRYFVENIFEGLDNPGEWYLDSNGDLYYYPLPGEDIESAEIVAPVLEQLVVLEDVDYVTIKNLIFAHTDWSPAENGWSGHFASSSLNTAICYKRTQNCSFENNLIMHIGNSGIGGHWYLNDSLDITGNEIHDIGANGIIIVNSEESLNTIIKSCVISNNIIHDVGIVYREGSGIYTNGIGMVVANNTIYNAPYSGIIFATAKYRVDLSRRWEAEWKTNTISRNDIYNVMQELNDGAGIYVSGQQPGSLIQNNYIHDILGTDLHVRKGMGTLHGIYADEGGKGFTIRDNLVVRTDNALLMHKSPDNLITNNIFIDSDYCDLAFSRYSNDPRDLEQPGNHFTVNIVYNTNGNSMLLLVYEENGRNNVEYSDYNLFFTTNRANHSWNLDWWKTAYGFDSHSLFADPLFADYSNDNFNLRSDSPAFDLGFSSFSLNNVGAGSN